MIFFLIVQNRIYYKDKEADFVELNSIVNKTTTTKTKHLNY